jgi:hypothetical protein
MHGLLERPLDQRIQSAGSTCQTLVSVCVFVTILFLSRSKVLELSLQSQPVVNCDLCAAAEMENKRKSSQPALSSTSPLNAGSLEVHFELAVANLVVFVLPVMH